MKKSMFVFICAVVMLVMFMQIVYGTFGIPFNYVFIGFAALLAFWSMLDGWKINYACVALLGIAALSIANNDIPEFFEPWERYVLFFALMGGCSPLINGRRVNKLRRQLFMGALWAVCIITVWSFIGRFNGQGAYIAGIVDGYMGVTGHPNFLGFFVMIAMVWLAALFFRCTENLERVIVATLWVFCLVVILMSASRTSTACGLIGTLVAVYLRLRKNAGSLLSVYAVLIGLAIFAWPVIAPYTDAMMKKNMDFDNTESMIASSRGAIWELRYAEIEESPWIGVGAYSCDINLPNARVFYDSNNGSIELGSSYLGMMAQCGWLGFIAFVSILLTVGLKAWKYATKYRTPYAQLMVSLYAALAAHMFFEGYAMTAGAIQCVILWLVIGAADQCDTVADYPVAWEGDEDPITPEEYVRWRDANGK